LKYAFFTSTIVSVSCARVPTNRIKTPSANITQVILSDPASFKAFHNRLSIPRFDVAVDRPTDVLY
jgi:hypothetical protein